ncbi:MAG: hypothetical protein RI967_1878, partial [Planctomycetota bacterium]
MHFICLAVLALGSLVSPGFAQASDSLDDMRTRIAAARARIDAQTKLYHDPVGPRTWIDGARLWYAESSPSGERRWWLVDARAEGAAARRPLFDHDEAARLLPPPNGGAVSATRLPVQGVAVEDGMVVVSFESVARPKVFDLETGRHRADAEAGSDAAAALELRLSPARARSVGQGASSGITFVNTLDEEVEILWVDARGQSKPYGRVPARGERRQHTFGGHAWMVRTASGEELGFAVASDVEKTLRIARAPATGKAGANAAREPEAVDQTDGQKETQDGESQPAAAGVEVGRDGPNLVIRADGREIFRTTDGVEGDAYTGGEWVSPARDAVVAMKVKRGARHPVHIVEAAPKDRLEPRLRTLDYTKPGGEIDRPVPRLFRIERAPGPGAPMVREVAVDTALVPHPWSLDRARFLSDGRELAFL